MPKRNTGIDEASRALLHWPANFKRMSNLPSWVGSMAAFTVALVAGVLVLSTGIIGRFSCRVLPLHPEASSQYDRSH